MRPIGYFVHHQGRGHAERCAAIAHALPPSRPLRIFCARDEIFPALPPSAEIEIIASLFEPTGDEAPGLKGFEAPRTLHCAPLGWPGIRRAMGRLAAWFAEADPALMICDVSAEIAQLARICSVPHVKVLQHGDRSDPGHSAAYVGAVGLLAPFSALLAQPDWDAAMRDRIYFAGGLGIAGDRGDREACRRRLGISGEREMILVMSGGGGTGFSQAPIAVGARSRPDAVWVTIGAVAAEWHATEPGNIVHCGWVARARDYIAAADLVVASTGNTTCHEILAAARPWIAVPEWRYFDEQHRKAACLEAAGLAVVARHLPSSAQDWDRVIAQAYADHRPGRQAAAIDDAPAAGAAAWLEALIGRIWGSRDVSAKRGMAHE